MPSHALALLVDLAVFWSPVIVFLSISQDRVPATGSLRLVTGGEALLILACWVVHSAGWTPGAQACGFRFIRRAGERPGWRFGLALTLVRVVVFPLAAAGALLAQVMAPASYSQGTGGYPVTTQRVARRAPLEAMDRWWRSYVSRWG